MIYRITSVFCFIFLSASLWAQNNKKYQTIDNARIKCTYLLEYQSDSTNKESIALEDMVLLVGDSISKFQSMNAYYRDSIVRTTNFTNLSAAMAQLSGYHTGFIYQLFKNYPRKKITFVERVFRDHFLIEQPMNLFNWKLSPDTTTISGYHCQKATTHYAGRAYTAWFTNEVPISEGPYKFNGLPGLIIKINDARRQYSFLLTALQRVNTLIPIDFPEKIYIKTTQKKFNKAKRDFLSNFRERAARMGFSFNITDKDLKKRLKRHNNAIEIGE